MGSGISATHQGAYKVEALKPADASDIGAGEAIEEVKRLRALLKSCPDDSTDLFSDLVALVAKHAAASSGKVDVLEKVVKWAQERLSAEQLLKDSQQPSNGSKLSTARSRQSLQQAPRMSILQQQRKNSKNSNLVSPRFAEASEEKQKAYKDAFALFDKNGDGTISVAELGEVMKSLGLNPTEADIEEIVEEVDADENGSLDFKEFSSIMNSQENRLKSVAAMAVLAARAKANMMLFDVNPDEAAMELAKCEKCAIQAGTEEKTGPVVDIEDLSVKEDNFEFQAVFEHAVPVDVPYELQTDLQSGLEVETLTGKREGQQVLHIAPWVLRQVAERAITHIEHYLRPGHLGQLASILKDEEASDNDRFVAESLLRNAVIAAKGTLPGCQDTGTAICLGKKGQFCWTGEEDEKHLSHGIYDAYTKRNLRYSQVSPVSMFAEKNTACNLPAQFDIYSVKGNEYKFMFMAKGGGSANKTYLFQQTKALLNPKSLEAFIKEKVVTLGTSACPPYHLAIVIGGLSAEMNLKTVKLASARYLDDLPQTGNALGRAYRDTTWEQKILTLCQGFGIGAQFGGKYFVHDVRVVRLPRHGASCPVGIGVSCSADRQILVKITPDGVFLEGLEKNPARFLPPEAPKAGLSEPVVSINLNEPMADILQTLTKYPIKTRLNLSGTIIVARDIAHAKLAERLERDGGLPDYMSAHVIYYAGPAKQPEGYASGSFGPTTAGRMDSYVPLFMKNGCSLLTLAKGNRSKAVTDACKDYGGFYLGSIGGAAANLAEHVIKKVDLVEYEELGMEAVWCIEVVDFPAFIIVDDKGNDFFSSWKM